MYKRIIAFALAFVTAFSLLPVKAEAAEEFSSTGNIWTAFIQWGGFGGIWDVIPGLICEDACAFSDDALHHGRLTSYVPNADGSFNALCNYCSDTFPVYDADLEAAYGTYVQGVEEEYGTSAVTNMVSSGYCLYNGVELLELPNGGDCDYQTIGININSGTYSCYFTSVPIYIGNGIVFPNSSPYWLKQYNLKNGQWSIVVDQSVSGFLGSISDMNLFWTSHDILNEDSSVYLAASNFVVLIDDNNDSIVGTTSRPTSITGNYGIIGDDGSLTKIDATTIVNEGDSTYYNPVTNTSHDLSGWIYDYSTRTYDLTTADDNSVTVTYGDENISITEGDTTYNVYYLLQSPDSGDDGGESGGSGSGSGSDDTHTHDYTSEITTAASCLLPGIRTYTCSCGDTYTKSIPATGHAWAISQQVNTTYDPDTGELQQQGYTVYVCNTCGEQYKDEGGTGPPNGSTGDSSEETVWDKLGNLLGTVVEGFLGLLDGLLGGLLDGMISLLETALGKLTRVVEIITSMFQEIPTLFGGFLDLLSAVFPFIPEDMMTVLTFGLVAIVAVGLWKAFRR